MIKYNANANPAVDDYSLEIQGKLIEIMLETEAFVFGVYKALLIRSPKSAELFRKQLIKDCAPNGIIWDADEKLSYERFTVGKEPTEY